MEGEQALQRSADRVIRESRTLSSDQIRILLTSARRSGRYIDRAELALALSIELGLTATRLAAMTTGDVYNSDGAVRTIIPVQLADGWVPLRISPKLLGLLADYREKHLAFYELDTMVSLFRSQRGVQMKPASMARLLTEVYRQAGIEKGSSRSGRRTFLISLRVPKT
jgi:integrase